MPIHRLLRDDQSTKNQARGLDFTTRPDSCSRCAKLDKWSISINRLGLLSLVAAALSTGALLAVISESSYQVGGHLKATKLTPDFTSMPIVFIEVFVVLTTFGGLVPVALWCASFACRLTHRTQ